MIKVRSKTLFIPAEEQSIGAVGEADSTVREFHIDRVSGDGVDLANLLFKLNIRYAGVREIDRSDLEKVVTDNAIILRWLISSVTLRNAGTAFLQLDAFDETGSCRWKSYPGAVYIEKSLGNTEIPSNTLSELEQLEKKFAKVGEGESARVEAEKKRVSAEEKREEAEGKRNTSLANIIAEEEKIKAVSKEAKGYKDSVLADKQEISAMKQEAVSAKTEALQYANTAEASKNSTITEGTKIMEAVTALKNEANTAKTDAVNAKNETVSEKNVANAIKDEMLALKTEVNTNTEKAKQNADKAESSANTAKTAETNAEAFKTEAGKSAEKAKESETKTLEALKKAEASGGAGCVTTEELHSYVDNAVASIHSGLSAEEVKQSAKAVIQENTFNGDGDMWKKLSDALYEGKTADLVFPSNNLIGAGVFKTLIEQISLYNEVVRNKQRRTYRSIASLYGMPEENTVAVLKEINKRIREDNYGDIRIGDYINVKLNGQDNPMKFVAVGIDFYKDIKQYNNSVKPSEVVGEKVPLKHIDFVCVDTDLTLDLNPQDIRIPTSIANIDSRCFVSQLAFKKFAAMWGENNLDFFHELGYKPYVDLPETFDPRSQQPYTFMTKLPLWVPTPEEVTGKYATFKGEEIGINDSKIALQYPYFAEHPEVFDNGFNQRFRPKLFSLSRGNSVAIYIANGNFIAMPMTLAFEKTAAEHVYIPLGFRLEGRETT